MNYSRNNDNYWEMSPNEIQLHLCRFKGEKFSRKKFCKLIENILLGLFCSCECECYVIRAEMRNAGGEQDGVGGARRGRCSSFPHTVCASTVSRRQNTPAVLRASFLASCSFISVRLICFSKYYCRFEWVSWLPNTTKPATSECKALWDTDASVETE